MPSAAKRLLQVGVLSSIASKPLSVPTMAAAVAINSCAFMLLLLFSHVVWVLLSLRVGRSADCATDHAARSARRPPSAPSHRAGKAARPHAWPAPDRRWPTPPRPRPRA